MAEFRYVDEGHTYWFGGSRVTGITEAMGRAGLSPKMPESARARRNFIAAGKRGTLVHDACELVDTGQGADYDFDPQVQGYVDAWASFCRDFKYRPTFIEVPLGHEVFRFGGRLDTAGQSEELGFCVVERKTRPLQDYDGFQIAAQEILLKNAESLTGLRLTLVGVQLKADGSYVYSKRYTENRRRYADLFLSAVNIANYQISQGR